VYCDATCQTADWKHHKRVHKHACAGLEKEKRLRVKVEEEHKELQMDLEDMYDEQNKAMLEDRRMKELLSGVRKSFLFARLEYGFMFPVRQMGELDDRTRRQEKGKCLPPCVGEEGKLGIAKLQSFVNDVKWHPTRVISSGTGDDARAVEQINWDDERLRAIEKRYPEQGVGSFVVECWKEIQHYNAS
jgi:hypothetical protein